MTMLRTVDEVAEQEGVSPQTVRRAILNGELRSVRIAGRVMVPTREFVGFLDHAFTAPVIGSPRPIPREERA